MSLQTCLACGWSVAAERPPLTCPQCDAELADENAPCECDVCKTAHERRPRFSDGTSRPPVEIPVTIASRGHAYGMLALEGLERRIRRLEACQDQGSHQDSLCPRCVAILQDRMGVRDPLANAAEGWWVSELSKISQFQSWDELRAGIIAASNKVLNLAKLMEEEERS